MKKTRLCAAAIASAAVFSSCGKAENAPKPLQEILFVVTDENAADSGGFTGCIIDADGCCRELPRTLRGEDGQWLDNWYEKALESACYPVKKTVSMSELNDYYTFVNSADNFIGSPLVDCGESEGSGTLSLYMLYRSPDGDMNYKLLCTYGQSVSCVDSDEVRDFVNRFAEHGNLSLRDFRY